MTRRIEELDLTTEELGALRRQGFVAREERRGREVFKLRFRMPSGKQCVRYLGTDPALAEELQAELGEMQAARRLDRELGRLMKEIGELLQSSKEQLAPLLAEAGYHFHGLSIRRKQVAK
ncbi:MAG: hypothetical protein NTY19_44425 [Planctomycetota bacterium]|nr:hypothetical protein [Planctomycetota bacterium]